MENAEMIEQILNEDSGFIIRQEALESRLREDKVIEEYDTIEVQGSTSPELTLIVRKYGSTGPTGGQIGEDGYKVVRGSPIAVTRIYHL